ncbi:helix-turn-helix domain-containing protein [Halostreptopolyspora alba]
MVLNDGERRRRVGREIRRRRERAGLTQAQLARILARAQTTVSAYEKGTRLPNVDDLSSLDQALSTGGALADLWQSLSKDGGDYASWFRDLVSVEADASEVREYQPLAIPGLLQTPGYARAQIRTGRPGETPAEIEEGVRGREQRQKILRAERGPVVSMIVEEHVLRRPIGGSETLKAQLDHLLEAAELPRLTLQAVPMNSEQHYGMDGAFILFKVPGRGQIAYRETRLDASPREDLEAVEEYMSVFGSLSAYALTPSHTRQLIERIRRDVDD